MKTLGHYTKHLSFKLELKLSPLYNILNGEYIKQYTKCVIVKNYNSIFLESVKQLPLISTRLSMSVNLHSLTNITKLQVAGNTIIKPLKRTKSLKPT